MSRDSNSEAAFRISSGRSLLLDRDAAAVPALETRESKLAAIEEGADMEWLIRYLEDFDLCVKCTRSLETLQDVDYVSGRRSDRREGADQVIDGCPTL